MIIKVQGVGDVGVNRDLSAHELKENAWTDARNIRFLDGMAYQFFGHGEVYNTPSYSPQFLLPCSVSGNRSWIYATATKVFVVTVAGGVAVHTDITPTTARAGIINRWTGTLLSGIPILNAGDATSVPMSWALNTAVKFVDLANWPASTYCKSIRAFKNYLIALNITKGSQNYPYMVKWSHPADPGSLPVSWDIADPTKDCGESDIAEGFDPIVDGLQLRDYFIIYKEASIWRMAFVGGSYIFSFTKVLGTSGAMNRNCIVEIDGYHVVLTNSDVIVHDGQSATSVLDKQTRRSLFQSIDATNGSMCFCFKNPYFNEVFVCYPSIGSSYCDMAMVWNYVDKTVAFREMPNVAHASHGPVDNSISGSWGQDSAPWADDLSLWGQPDFVPDGGRVIMASADGKLFMLDASSSFDGVVPHAYMERRGLSLGAPEKMKTVRGIRPRISGPAGQTVSIRIGGSDDPYAEPTWGPVMNHVIGETVRDGCFVSGRYIAVKFETGTSYQWRLDSYDIDVVSRGMW